MLSRAVLLVLMALGLRADVRTCVCFPSTPGVAAAPGCSLCAVAEKRPVTETVFLVKDIDPSKPNRWLALPRAAYDGPNPLAHMPAAERLALWNLAIAKGKELWGDDWAVAMNSDFRRLQCHLHVHIGKLLEGKELDSGAWIDGPAGLPALNDGNGLWFHPVGDRLHVHIDPQAPEFLLMR